MGRGHPRQRTAAIADLLGGARRERYRVRHLRCAVGHPAEGRRHGTARRHRVRARRDVRTTRRHPRLRCAGEPDHVRAGPGRSRRARRIVARRPCGAVGHDRDRLPALRHDPGIRHHRLPERRVGPRADRDPCHGLGRPRAACRQHGARPRHDLRRTQRWRRARDRGVRHDGRSPDRRRRDRRQRARQPHARLLRGAGRERERHGLPDPREPCARHEQHRDRRDRVRGDRSRPHGRSGARRDRAGQRGLERRQLRQPRVRLRPKRRRHLRRRRSGRADRSQRRARHQHRDRARERARRPSHEEHHRPEQPGLRRDGDRRGDRRLRPATRQHRRTA